MSSAKQSLFKELDLDEPQWDVFSMTYDALKARLAEAVLHVPAHADLRIQHLEARLTEVEAERATMISVVASARERADNAERECARLKAAWDAAYEQAMQNGAAANEAKARLAEVERIVRAVDKVGAQAIANYGSIVLTQGAVLFTAAANYLVKHGSISAARTADSAGEKP